MKEINKSYGILSDAQRRLLYDVHRHAGLEGYTEEDICRGVDFSKLFREFGLRDFFGFSDSRFDSFLYLIVKVLTPTNLNYKEELLKGFEKLRREADNQ